MSPTDLEMEVQALSYLVTVIIHRLHETDPTWWRELRDELRADRNSTLVGSGRAKVLGMAIAIMEQALKPGES